MDSECASADQPLLLLTAASFEFRGKQISYWWFCLQDTIDLCIVRKVKFHFCLDLGLDGVDVRLVQYTCCTSCTGIKPGSNACVPGNGSGFDLSDRHLFARSLVTDPASEFTGSTAYDVLNNLLKEFGVCEG